MRFYFAYGSNLNILQMKSRCPDAVMIGKAKLKDYKLDFNHYANVIKKRGCCVYGGLWAISENDESSLDFVEGVKRNLYFKDYLDIWYKGQKVYNVLTYIMVDTVNRKYKRPLDAYLACVKQSYEDFKINLKYLEKILD